MWTAGFKSERLHFDEHVLAVLKECSQRMYLLKLLRDHWGPSTGPIKHLNEVRYVIPAWSGFLSAHLTSQINGLLKRCFKYGYCAEINSLEDLIESANCKLFKNSQNHQHCYLQLNLRTIGLISGLKNISTRSQITPQNYINVPSSHIAYSSIINLSFHLLYIVYLFLLFYMLYHFNCFYWSCTFITCIFNRSWKLKVELEKDDSTTQRWMETSGLRSTFHWERQCISQAKSKQTNNNDSEEAKTYQGCRSVLHSAKQLLQNLTWHEWKLVLSLSSNQRPLHRHIGLQETTTADITGRSYCCSKRLFSFTRTFHQRLSVPVCLT